MFDENKSKLEEGQNPSAPKEQIEDIFSDTEKIPKPDAFKPKQPEISGVENLNQKSDSKKATMKKIIVLTVIILGIALIAFGSYWAYNKFGKNIIIGDVNMIKNDGEKTEAGEKNTQAETSQPTSKTIMPEDAESVVVDTKDTDQDGLTDEEEIRAGSNINAIDTDDDGLFDREEVKVYRTNPANADTDGDGFLDGDEVKAGYNPNGSGKLFDIK